MRRVSEPLGYSATYLAVGLSLVPQILIVPERTWKFLVGCPAAFFVFMGVFGLCLPLVSPRSRTSYRDRGATDGTLAALFGAAVVSIATAGAALAIHAHDARAAVALLAAALTTFVVVALRRTPPIHRARSEIRRHF
jgi:hypothetical protein